MYIFIKFTNATWKIGIFIESYVLVKSKTDCFLIVSGKNSILTSHVLLYYIGDEATCGIFDKFIHKNYMFLFENKSKSFEFKKMIDI